VETRKHQDSEETVVALPDYGTLLCRVPLEAPARQVPKGRPRRWRWVVLIVVIALVWIGFMLRSGKEKPSLVLPDGVRVTYFGNSKGVAAPGSWGNRTYKHPIPPQGPLLKRTWQKVRGWLPGWLGSRLPVWDYQRDRYPDWGHPHECELQFRVLGEFKSSAWGGWKIGIVDENGWENPAEDYISGEDGRYERGLSAQKSGWLRVGSPYPRHCKTLKVRFRPSASATPGLKEEERLAQFTDFTLRNPFYEGPAPAGGDRLPITKPFRDGQFTLLKLSRDPVLTGGSGMLDTELKLERAGKLWPGFEVRELLVSDSSGQLFRSTSGHGMRGDTMVFGINTGPWSDDSSWKLRFRLHRGRDSKTVDESEIFRFEKLPVPSAESVTLNREITRNGITLRLGTLEPLNRFGESRFTVEGWVRDDPMQRVIIPYDARDDQGRTQARLPNGAGVLLVGGPVGSDHGDPTFAVHSIPGAESWDLPLVPETITEVEFRVQPPASAPKAK
jgi:hypothetical protein